MGSNALSHYQTNNELQQLIRRYKHPETGRPGPTVIVDILFEIGVGTANSPTARVAAANALADRLWGRPVATEVKRTEHDLADLDLSRLSGEELHAFKTLMGKVLGESDGEPVKLKTTTNKPGKRGQAGRKTKVYDDSDDGGGGALEDDWS